ncbi:MAG: hypothetical protein TU35_007255 [Thermoproteus sp. AZ2]|jgi:hypothetical protein|uniref:Uncharacterized protein n=1 Tax=Thermoproteus sp. AZ2 TaxID=1609232 RepID=A0ACC6V1S8_9CREN|nr:MAG: hypothetical protein TU35_04820 [Thermoproteus sp. AZ2]
MRRIGIRLISRSYADEAMAQMLMAIGGVYNVYFDGDVLYLEVDEGVIAPGEAVRRALDLGYEALLPHYVFSTRRGDPWKIKERVEAAAAPFLVAATYDVDEGYIYAVAVPGTGDEEVLKWAEELGVSASLVDKYYKPVRLSFG